MEGAEVWVRGKAEMSRKNEKCQTPGGKASIHNNHSAKTIQDKHKQRGRSPEPE